MSTVRTRVRTVRSTVVVAAAVAIVLAMLTPAEAVPQRAARYKISLSPAPKIAAPRYNDSMLDLSSSTAPANTFTTIRAKVSGGRVKGRTVKIYATNTNRSPVVRRSLGTARLSSKGYFTKRFNPGVGNAGVYRIDIVKPRSNGRKAATRSFSIRVLEFVPMELFYDAAASNPDPTRTPPAVRLATVGEETRVAPERGGEAGYWRTGFTVGHRGTAVFRPAGFSCYRYLFKLGVSMTSAGDRARFDVRQAGRPLMAATMTRYGSPGYTGPSFVEPSRAQSQGIDGRNEPLTVTVTGVDPVADADVRGVMGRPRLSCAYPIKGTPRRTS